MAARRFTDSYLTGLQPKPSPYKVRDASDVRGFGCQVSTAGAKSFFLSVTIAGTQRFIGLGRYVPPQALDGERLPSNLVERRELARRLRGMADQGLDPRAWLAEQAAPAATRGTFGELLDRYVESLGNRPSAEHARRVFDNDIRPVVDTDLPANEITSRMLSRALARIIERGALVQANRTHAYLSAAFGHARRFDNDPNAPARAATFELAENPVAVIPKPLAEEAAGERNLSFDEIRALWRALGPYGGMSDDTKVVVRMLLATGQRVETVLHAPFAEFDLDAGLWDIPAGRMKKKRAHVVPVHPMVAEMVVEQRRRHRGTWLFPNPSGTGPMVRSSLSRAVQRFCQRTAFEPFTARDLRRTWKSRGGQLGIAKIDRDRLQAHAVGADVSSRHYDRHDYAAEKRAAMNAWCEHLRALVASA